MISTNIIKIIQMISNIPSEAWTILTLDSAFMEYFVIL